MYDDIRRVTTKHATMHTKSEPTETPVKMVNMPSIVKRLANSLPYLAPSSVSWYAPWLMLLIGTVNISVAHTIMLLYWLFRCSHTSRSASLAIASSSVESDWKCCSVASEQSCSCRSRSCSSDFLCEYTWKPAATALIAESIAHMRARRGDVMKIQLAVHRSNAPIVGDRH